MFEIVRKKNHSGKKFTSTIIYLLKLLLARISLSKEIEIVVVLLSAMR